MNAISGLKIVVRYSLIPCHLGLCGPINKEEGQRLKDFLLNKKISANEIRKILKKTKDAYRYCRQIAEKNSINDIFDIKVVEAYWTGNSLLKKLNNSNYHNFHVYQVAVLAPAKLRDVCRISWGQIMEIKGDVIIVKYQPIIKVKNRFCFGEEKKKEISWDKTILPENLKIDDYISIHWKHAIERLSKKRLANLIKYTELSLKPKTK